MSTALRVSSPAMSEMNITPLVDVMLVLLVIFMVTAPMAEHRLALGLPQAAPPITDPPKPLQLQIDSTDVYRLNGQMLSRSELSATLAAQVARLPGTVVKVDVSPDADYQSAVTALALVRAAGVQNFGLDPR